MRYAHGIILGAVLSFVIFLGAAIIKILAIPWEVYAVWFFLSIGIVVLPPILVYFARKDAVREFLIYEAGGLGLFSPLWLILFTDLSGDSWVVLFTEGIVGGLPAPGPAGPLVQVDISNIILIPILIFFLLIGVIFLRPSFIAKHGVKGEMAELRDLKESTEPVTTPTGVTSETIEEDPIEKDLPAVAPPEASADTMADLRGLLTELGTPEPTINLIFNAGIATTTDLVATSPEQLATLTGIDKRTAEDLHMAVQKKVWFGGI
ncbi:MAG: hypothetical protein ThorAB25_07320 [Candidatus Thorarchaeota archaeon AB_25]|nr:MAG: hypothetical protein ThorAB25_07320 [Candidatus Thorarchaeota archaeon AB_25]